MSLLMLVPIVTIINIIIMIFSKVVCISPYDPILDLVIQLYWIINEGKTK